jgi:hypothetical protein
MSNQPKFTPGPWSVDSNFEDSCFVGQPDGEPVASLLCDRNQDMHANARLIAAAPELHSLLESVLSHFKATGMSREESELNTEICKLLSKIGGAE